MSEFGGPFRSHTYEVDDFTQLDEAIEQNLAALAQEGYELLSGPSIIRTPAGTFFFTNVFKRAKKSGVATTMHGYS